jgi:hypothetical protein
MFMFICLLLGYSSGLFVGFLHYRKAKVQSVSRGAGKQGAALDLCQTWGPVSFSVN